MHLSLLSLLGRFSISLAIVLGAIFLLARLAKKNKGILKGNGSIDFEVIARKSLSKNASLAVIKLHDQEVLIGITPSSITLLSKEQQNLATANESLEDSELLEELKDLDLNLSHNTKIKWTDFLKGKKPSSAWMAGVEQLRELTLRRN